MTGSAVSQLENTSWVFYVQYRMKHTSPQRKFGLRNPPGTLAHFPPGPRVEGLYPGLGTQNSLGQRRCPGQKVLKWVPPRKWLIYIPVSDGPGPPIVGARGKKG